jgi:diadenosine tetraphosphate (Ap4A) HIT family hydrolase
MPLRVLRKHEIVDKDGELVTLNAKKLTFEQKAQIKMICEKKLQEFIVKRGLGIWDYRLLDTNPVPDSLYYNVLKDSNSRCELCGATKNERPLHVDHIKPRSKGGKTEYDNLQVLCSKCNQAKGNKDDKDFRDFVSSDSEPDCKFCYENIKSRIIEEYNSVVVIKDNYPVSKDHCLIVPKRHVSDYFSMTTAEKMDSDNLLRILQKRISSSDSTVTGFNIGINCGESAGQTIFHAHLHLIPRRVGDTPNPRGGVRGVIPDKMDY